MRQAGVLAAAADFSVDHVHTTLKKDHHHAQQIAKGNGSGSIVQYNVLGVIKSWI